MKAHYLALLLVFVENAHFVLMCPEGQSHYSASWTLDAVRKPLNRTIIEVTFDTVSLIGCASACTWSTRVEPAPSFNFEQDHGRCHCNNATDDTEEDQNQPEVTYGVLQIGATRSYRSDCHAYYKDGFLDDRFYKIQPCMNGPIKNVSCYMEQEGIYGEEGWTFILLRKAKDGGLSFNRSWTEYVNGFGDSNGDYWIGLESIHQLTKHGMRLRTHAGLRQRGSSPYRSVGSTYSHFRVGDAASNYTLNVSGFWGQGGDSLSSHNGLPFSAPYGDNDCANACAGGWWYRSDGDCGQANLNRMRDGHDSKQCPMWATFDFAYKPPGLIPYSSMYISIQL